MLPPRHVPDDPRETKTACDLGWHGAMYQRSVTNVAERVFAPAIGFAVETMPQATPMSLALGAVKVRVARDRRRSDFSTNVPSPS